MKHQQRLHQKFHYAIAVAAGEGVGQLFTDLGVAKDSRWSKL